MKRIGMLALAVLLVLPMASCSWMNTAGEDTGELDRSLLAERRITLNEESPLLLDICGEGSEFTVISTDENREVLHRSTLTLAANGKSEQSDLVGIARVASGQLLRAAAVSPENDVVYSYASENGTMTSYLVDSEGRADELDMEPTAVGSIGYMDSRSLIFEDQARDLVRFDMRSGKVEATYSLSSGQFFGSYVVVKDRLIAIASEVVDAVGAFSTKVFDLESGEEVSDLAALTQAIDALLSKDRITDGRGAPVLSWNAKTEEFSVLLDGSIYSINKNNEASLLADGESTNLTNTALLPSALVPSENGFIMLYRDPMSFGFKPYSYRFGRPKAEATLTIYMLEDNQEIRQAAALYREENERVEVLTQVGMPAGTTLTVEDVIRQLNLDILAGNGPDILVLDGLSVDQFQKENLLVDLSDVVGRMEATDDGYFESVLTCFADGGSGCYAVPTRFTIPAIMVDRGLLARIKSMEDLAGMVESHRGEERTFLNISCDLSVLFTADYANIVQGGSVSKEGLSRFFEQAKRMVDVSKETYGRNEARYPTKLDVVEMSLGGFTDRQYTYMDPSAVLLEPSNQLAWLGPADRVQGFPLIDLTVHNTDGDLAFGLLRFTDRQAFSPSTVLGISTSCPNVELAKQFIEFALSKEQQKPSLRGVGLPVNKTAFKEALERASVGGVGVSAGRYSYSYGPLSDEEMQAHLKLVDSVEVPCITDRVITDLVRTGLESYLRDQTTLTEAVESTYQKISLYILE
jgi:hypothetical protein